MKTYTYFINKYILFPYFSSKMVVRIDAVAQYSSCSSSYLCSFCQVFLLSSIAVKDVQYSRTELFMDKLQLQITSKCMDYCVTVILESWLDSWCCDGICRTSGHATFRADRTFSISGKKKCRGGLCVFRNCTGLLFIFFLVFFFSQN